MSFADILSACFGGGGGSAASNSPQYNLREAPFLSPDDAAQMPLDTFLERSLISGPSAAQNTDAFMAIYKKHLEGGADPIHVFSVIQRNLGQLAANDVDAGTTYWACQMLGLLVHANQGSGYAPPAMPAGSYAQALASGNEKLPEPVAYRPPPHKVSDSDIYIRSYFFPSEESFSALINFIGSAKSTLDICVFNITDNDVTRAIADAKHRGVDVRIITDDEQLKCQGNDVERMRDQYGIPFKTDTDTSKFMHSKFAIIDRRAVWSGSYNWTVSARRSNNESAICTNDPNTAQSYCEEFEKLWDQF
ncbi:hypothetical protein GGI15_000165 [Coemansia interrupta]|uniref:Mitochondrial cardiolipin hydrolase n=1 Tax=Coemansia interrupta TaxID=1126814 RepID=A0A9W8HMB3_9FUNG|nr:hypothetical protein GGI15_000165 [Coemansia interrupta]